MTLAEMTKKSINTAFAQLASDVGSCNIPKVMSKMGLTDGYGLPYGLSYADGKKVKDDYAISNLVLGSDSTSPLQLASSYATLAADGKYCPPNPIESITTASGKKMKIKKPACKQVIEPDVARGVTQLLLGPLEPGGTAWLVVAKQLGADSLQRWVGERFADAGLAVRRAATDRGYRVLAVSREVSTTPE